MKKISTQRQTCDSYLYIVFWYFPVFIHISMEFKESLFSLMEIIIIFLIRLNFSLSLQISFPFLLCRCVIYYHFSYQIYNLNNYFL